MKAKQDPVWAVQWDLCSCNIVNSHHLCENVVFEQQICRGHQLTWSSRFWTMISCPDAAASIRGVKPDPGSLWAKENALNLPMGGRHRFWDERTNSLDIGISVVIQQELDHLLVACARTVKQSSPAPTVLQLQLGTLLWEEEKQSCHTLKEQQQRNRTSNRCWICQHSTA